MFESGRWVCYDCSPLRPQCHGASATGVGTNAPVCEECGKQVSSVAFVPHGIAPTSWMLKNVPIAAA